MHWLYGRGTIDFPTFDSVSSTVFAPVAIYCVSDLPGSEMVSGVSDWCVFMGESVFTFDVHIDWSPEITDDPSEIPQDQD